ncbi:hypothetical protein [Pseudoalteromonas sp. S2755]|uniref:hypothetical protein n=1 Tax=Pseudoalteromonas sp. S2755 TaxID=2066523 RepID=UPI00110A3173|nr:hypothetical protein [Pseudoalteromonas sp. S2755]TMN35994.1 hypothetical protein CWC03_14550 [Pseudoalteromonas sp. S2755]
MFKKSLLAVALTTAATSAMAVNTTAGTAQKLSVEGAVATSAAITANAPTVALNLNAQYTAGDTVTLTLTGGAEFADTGYRLTKQGNAGDTVTWGLINSSKTELVFRVTETNDADNSGSVSTEGLVYNLEATGNNSNEVLVKLPDLADKAKVTVTTVAKTSTGITIDTATGTGNTDSADLFVGTKQFSVTSFSKADGTVDVAQLRKGFEKTGGVEQIPAPSFVVAENATDIATIADDNVELTLKGDFTGVSKVTVKDNAAAADELKIAADAKSATGKTGAALVAGTYTINFELPAADKRVALTAPQDFTLDVNVLEGTTKSSALVSGSVASSWKLNGDSEFVEIMPFSDVYSRAIMVTNNGTVEGDIMVELYSGGKMVATKKVGTAAKYAVTNVTAAVDALAKENEITGVAGIRVTTNAPAANIEVSALYYNKDVQDHVKVN